jgi:CDP-diacylglycerol--glycerol-3-phosphate 3-phosphatidyltransferase
MFTEHVRQWSRGIVNPMARFIGWTGVSPNVITLVGFGLTAGVALLLARGYVQLAGFLLIPAAILDAIDGTLARMFNQTTRFGAFLDSTMDRFSEAVLILGALVYFQAEGASTQVILCYVTIVGSLMVSYTRARAQGIGVEVKEGLLTRVERALILIAALVFNELTLALWVLALLTNFTALQRIWKVWRATRAATTDR